MEDISHLQGYTSLATAPPPPPRAAALYDYAPCCSGGPAELKGQLLGELQWEAESRQVCSLGEILLTEH